LSINMSAAGFFLFAVLVTVVVAQVPPSMSDSRFLYALRACDGRIPVWACPFLLL
jgi:hypothetical protein